MSEKAYDDPEAKHGSQKDAATASKVTALTSADLFEDGTVDPVYQAKARVLNAALQDIGMGKYQVREFCSQITSAYLDHTNSYVVVVICSSRVWVVRVCVFFRAYN